MKYLFINFVLTVLLSACSNPTKTAKDENDTHYSILTEYKNTYNDFGKLSFVSVENKLSEDLSYSEERLYTYKDDTVLIKEEQYEIMPDHTKQLTYSISYDDGNETSMYFTDNEMVTYQERSYNKDRLLIKEKFIDNAFPDYKENFEQTIFYDSENRISYIDIIDHIQNKTTRNSYKYETNGDTLVTNIYNNGEIFEIIKTIDLAGNPKKYHYFDNLKNVSINERIQQDNDSYIDITMIYKNNKIASTDSIFYHSDKRIKTVLSYYEDGTTKTSTGLFEYDKHGSLIKETRHF